MENKEIVQEGTLQGQLSEARQSSLVGKWSPLLEANDEKLAPVKDNSMKKSVAVQLENTEKWMKEQGYLVEDANGQLSEATSVAANLGVFTPIVIPTTRRIAPGLLANQIVGVQPMSTPTGYAFAWRASYAGDGSGTAQSSSSALGVANTVSPLHRGDTASTKAGPQWGSVILIFTTGPGATSDVAVGDDVRDTTGGGGNIHGTVKYFETSDGVEKVLVDYVMSGDNPAFPFATATDLFFETDNDEAFQCTSIVGNEIMHNAILKGYSGPVTTAAGEALGSDMKEISTTMERVTVTAQTRKLKAEYTIEMAQDLKSVHGMDAEAELQSILQYEVTQEIDRELIAAINDNATAATGWSYGAVGVQSDNATYADGQWEQEKLRTIYTKIIKESNLIAKTTRRGPGNFIIGSINAISALESLSNFMYAPVAGNVTPISGGVSRVGTIDSRFAVYVDTFNEGADYITVGHKGAGNMDSGVIYCPYIPMMLMKTIHEQTFQPVMGVMTRSAIAYNLNGTANYYRKFATAFTNSQFA